MKRIFKSKVFLFFVITGVVFLLVALFFGGTKSVKIGEIKYFSFGYNNGAAMDASASYTLKLKDSVYIASVKPLYEPEEATKTFTVDESFVRELEQLLIQYKVGKWNGFNKFNKMVMDGSNFGLSVIMTDGTSLDAHGYMKWPKNYSAVKGGIEALFERGMAQGSR